MKNIKWNESARNFVVQLDKETKKEIGVLLFMVQCGCKLTWPNSKPMKSIHQNAFELRIRDGQGIYRLIYVLKSGDDILIPHAFTKKSEKTPFNEIKIAIKRLKELMNEIK